MRMINTENGPLFEGTPEELAFFLKELERLNSVVENGAFFNSLIKGIHDLPENEGK